jgi:hypothetical protein
VIIPAYNRELLLVGIVGPSQNADSDSLSTPDEPSNAS